MTITNKGSKRFFSYVGVAGKVIARNGTSQDLPIATLLNPMFAKDLLNGIITLTLSTSDRAFIAYVLAVGVRPA